MDNKKKRNWNENDIRTPLNINRAYIETPSVWLTWMVPFLSLYCEWTHLLLRNLTIYRDDFVFQIHNKLYECVVNSYIIWMQANHIVENLSQQARFFSNLKLMKMFVMKKKKKKKMNKVLPCLIYTPTFGCFNNQLRKNNISRKYLIIS